MTAAEERVVATHEAGHAVCALFCPHAPPIERITIASEVSGALGFVRYQDPTHRYIVTRGELLDDLCVLMGGREAELLLLDDLSIGSAHDLSRATEIARALVEEFGMGGDVVGVRSFRSGDRDGKRPYSLEFHVILPDLPDLLLTGWIKSSAHCCDPSRWALPRAGYPVVPAEAGTHNHREWFSGE